MNRKKFIKTCGFACAGSTLIATLLQSCVSTNYFAQHTLINDRIVINKNEFVKVEKDKTIERKYILIESVKYNYPIYVCKTSEDEYSAVLMQCTHKSCELQPHGDYLACPCHGSEFTNKGIVQNPPAEENLQTFIVTTDDDNLYIN